MKSSDNKRNGCAITMKEHKIIDKKEKITKGELAEKLQVQMRSIDSYIQEKSLPIPKYPVYPETEMYFLKSEIG